MSFTLTAHQLDEQLKDKKIIGVSEIHPRQNSVVIRFDDNSSLCIELGQDVLHENIVTYEINQQR